MNVSHFFVLLSALFAVPTLAADIQCVLHHSSSATVRLGDRMDVRASDKDSVAVKITGAGEQKAMLNGQFPLSLLKEIDGVYYYMQPSEDGMAIWAYYKKAQYLTYSKTRSYPVTRLPDTYFLAGQCK